MLTGAVNANARRRAYKCSERKLEPRSTVRWAFVKRRAAFVGSVVVSCGGCTQQHHKEACACVYLMDIRGILDPTSCWFVTADGTV